MWAHAPAQARARDVEEAGGKVGLQVRQQMMLQSWQLLRLAARLRMMRPCVAGVMRRVQRAAGRGWLEGQHLQNQQVGKT